MDKSCKKGWERCLDHADSGHFNIHSSTARPEVYYCEYVLLNESPFLVHSSEGHGARNQTIEVAAAAVTLATTCLSMTHHAIPPSCDRLNLSQIRT